ncbi:hypothetical protein ABZP36_018416 [Zizania latifolia]
MHARSVAVQGPNITQKPPTTMRWRKRASHVHDDLHREKTKKQRTLSTKTRRGSFNGIQERTKDGTNAGGDVAVEGAAGERERPEIIVPFCRQGREKILQFWPSGQGGDRRNTAAR